MMRTLLPLSFVLAATSAWAQAPALRLTVDEAIARGLENSHRIAELRARGEGAEAVEASRRAQRMPSVALVGGYTRTNHVDEFRVFAPGQPSNVIYPDLPDNFRTRLDLQWPIYTGGRVAALERAARAEREATAEDLAAARADLRLEITRAFWALVTARETAQVLARSLDSITAHVRDLRNRLEQGLIPPNDLLSAEAQQSRQRLQAIEASNLREVATAELQRLLGIDADAPIEPVAALETAAPPVQEPGPLVALARSQRPERRALEDRVAGALARAEATDAGALPQISVAGGYDYASPNVRHFPRTDEWRTSWDVSVNATWLLWDGGRRRAERAEADAAVRAAQSRVGEVDRQIAFEVRQRTLEVDSSRAAIAAAADGVRSAAEARRVVSDRFAAGVATSTDVLDAEVALLQASLDRTRALATARLADARLVRAVGQK